MAWSEYGILCHGQFLTLSLPKHIYSPAGEVGSPWMLPGHKHMAQSEHSIMCHGQFLTLSLPKHIYSPAQEVGSPWTLPGHKHMAQAEHSILCHAQFLTLSLQSIHSPAEEQTPSRRGWLSLDASCIVFLVNYAASPGHNISLWNHCLQRKWMLTCVLM